jgi:hypothetical protein
MWRRFLTWLKDQWILDEPSPLEQAVTAANERMRLLPEGPQLVEYITADQVERELGVQARLPRDQVDARLVEFLLDMRSMVGPTVTGSRMAAGAPVIPGRSS